LQLTDERALREDFEKQASASKKALKTESDERVRLMKANAELKSQLEKLKGKGSADKDAIEALKRENSNLKAEVQTVKKANAASEKEHKGREIRLARALEECDKFKETLSRATDETKGSTADYRKEKDRLVSQVRSLERQRAELLTAFRKQMKLIEVMKRMKVHVEASKLLEFSEEEFLKVLDWE
jgi:hypothetical protein